MVLVFLLLLYAEGFGFWNEGGEGGEMSFQDLEAGRPLMGRVNGRQDPTQAVAAGLFQINTAVATFQRLVNTLGTPKDAPMLREKL